MQRILESEWLDTLPPNDPRAIRSRRDLRLLNALMGNAKHIAAPLAQRPKPRRVMDLGCGDGRFALNMARALKWHDVQFLLVDRVPTIADETRSQFLEMGCHPSSVVADITSGLPESADVVFTNLFLHHFEDGQLRGILSEVASKCSCFVSCEPRRSAAALLASRCVGLIGCNDVTRHDAPASVRAGFRGQELSALWPSKQTWSLDERAVGMFGHLFLAARADMA